MIANKRGLSPVIATVLLIAISLVLAAIIFLWARGFLAEKLQKDIGNGAQPIDVACEQVDFDAEASISLSPNELIIDAINRGNIPIYGLELKKKNKGSVISFTGSPYTFSKLALLTGESDSIIVLDTDDVGESLIISPVILGEANDETRPYSCEKKAISLNNNDVPRI